MPGGENGDHRDIIKMEVIIIINDTFLFDTFCHPFYFPPTFPLLISYPHHASLILLSPYILRLDTKDVANKHT